jgi:poly-gamma-glutamate synthesis protein (capsule biosynthesis protein)
MRLRAFAIAHIALSICLLAAACTSDSQVTDVSQDLTRVTATLSALSPSTTPSSTATQELPILKPTDTLTQTPTPAISLWVAPYIPDVIYKNITQHSGIVLTSDPNNASYRLEVGKAQPVSYWIYALVAPFPTITDSVTSEDVRLSWKGESSGPFAGLPLLIDENTKAIFTTLWGKPDPESVLVIGTDNLLDYAWEQRPAWSIVPFENIEPRWKVLEIDGQSPIHKDFNLNSYPLTVPLSLISEVDISPESLTSIFDIPSSNRNPSKLTTIALTGVTALVRGTALTMEHKGITYPAQDIGFILREADITHISNEIPFTPECPYPELYPPELNFCSDPSYMGLLEEIGTDIVELTGDHFGDYGTEGMNYTLTIYNHRNWPYYGGGSNSQEAQQAQLIEINGNRLAFIGCNIGCDTKTEISCDALASENKPGAATCDFEWLQSEIERLNNDGYLIIATLQHKEYYTYKAEPDLVRDFSLLAEAGASIVSGSQAHQAHGMAFNNNSFVHYGLGNLFFDQYNYCADYACNYAFIDRHVFYEQRHVSTELITIRFVDLAKSRLMTSEERVRFLQTIFDASGW